MKTRYDLIGFGLVGGLCISLGVWFGGFSLEAMDMANAGYQVFGFLGTVAFGALNLIFWRLLRPKWAAHRAGGSHAR